MKRCLIIILLACCTLSIKAQETDLNTVDHLVLDIPESKNNSADSIASFIQSNFKNDKEKFRAIYRWVTYNIRYDKDSMYVFNWGGDQTKKVTAALRRKKGVCENYTAVFHEIASKCNLQSYIISGYTKQSGTIDKVGHSWCAVNLDNEWLLCDPTWDEHYTINPNYFLVAPSLFIESHMPFDPLWQLLDRPITAREFKNGNRQLGIEKTKYNFIDSVKTFMKMNELQQLETSAARIKKAGIENELTKTHLDYIEMNASILYEDRDMKQYNTAVAELNKATAIFNDFVQYRNNQFMPAKPDAEMLHLLVPVDRLFASVEKRLNELDRSETNAQYDTQGLKYDMAKFKSKVEVQKDFLKLYLATEETGRKKLFYSN
ncbi:MAG: transglutaminase domain-containing protein [Ferruginibacter sp.]